MVTKDEAKRKIEVLVNNFKEDKESGKAAKFNEEKTKNEFIIPIGNQK